MPALLPLVAALDSELRHSAIVDYTPALNGLQLANKSGQVTRVAAAVDACLPVIRRAVDLGADFLIVHHGLFWSGLQPHTGAQFEKLRLAMDAGLAIYSSHLPLDAHPTLGNNAVMLRALGLEPESSFMPYKGTDIGLRCCVDLSRDELMRRVQAATGFPAHLCPGGPEQVQRLGLVTGGAGDAIAAAAAQGIDTFITGEGPHWSYTLAEELGVNLIYAGHYATETFGVKALARHLEGLHHLPWDFIDHPTGL
jgi:dinuclear metal center YbgI/SA1388 family protein